MNNSNPLYSQPIISIISQIIISFLNIGSLQFADMLANKIVTGLEQIIETQGKINQRIQIIIERLGSETQTGGIENINEQMGSIETKIEGIENINEQMESIETKIEGIKTLNTQAESIETKMEELITQMKQSPIQRKIKNK